MNSVEKKINSIKSFVNADIPNLSLFSAVYFRYIISHMDFSEPYYVFYGDVDKLNDYNRTHGFDEGTKALHSLIGNVLEFFPDDTVSARIGGDEFAFVVPESTATAHDWKSLNILDKQQKHLKFHSKDLNMSLGCSLATSSTDFQQALVEAENQVASSKRSSKGTIAKNDWQSFSETSRTYVSSFFDAFRFSPLHQISKDEFFNRISLFLENSAILLNTPNLETPRSSKNENPHFAEAILSPEKLRAFHNYIISDNSSLPSNLSVEDIDVLYDTLSRNPVTGLYNRMFFENTLLPQLGNKDVSQTILFYSLIGMKRSNELLGHNYTDKCMREISDNVQENLSSFTDMDKSYNIDLKGGNFLTILPNSANLNTVSLQRIFNFRKPSGFEIVYNASSNVSSKDILQETNKLIASCDAKKDSIKQFSMYSDKSSHDLLKLVLSQLCTSYLQSFDNPLDYENKRRFSNSIFEAVHDKNIGYLPKPENSREEK